MKKMRVSFLILAALIVVGMSAAISSADFSPLAPAFVRYTTKVQAAKALGLPSLPTSEGGRSLGYVPGPFDWSHLDALYAAPEVKKSEKSNAGTSSSTAAVSAAALPARYDLRDYSYVTPIRNQGVLGTCWAHSTVAAMESNLLVRGKGAFDLSEWQIAYYGYQAEPGKSFPTYSLSATDVNIGGTTLRTGGGFDQMVAAMATRGSSPVSESSAPYPCVNGSLSPSLVKVPPVPYSPSHKVVGIHNIVNFYRNPHITGSRVDLVKQTIMQYGAVSVSYYYSNSGESNDRKSFFFSTTKYDTNHAVAIVGWDDNYSASNFRTNPGRNGAWIVRNSWGQSYGSGGYFYMSYAEGSLKEGVAFETSDAANDTIYQHDPLGLVSSYGWQGSTSAQFANVFTARGNEAIYSVAFYALAPNTTYEVSVHTGLGANSPIGTQNARTSGTFEKAGYNTISLSSPVMLANGQKFSIVAKVNTPGYNFPIPLESQNSWYSYAAKANAGESYMSKDGGNWYDMTAYSVNTNVCLKAFGIPSGEIVRVSSVTLDRSSVSLKIGDTTTITASVSPSNATSKGVSWRSSDPTVVTVNGGVANGVKPGTATITATTDDGSKTASCNVTVINEKIKIEKIVATDAPTTLGIGAVRTVHFAFTPSTMIDKTISATSSNGNVLKATANGEVCIVEAITTGTATVTVKSNFDPSASVSFNVNVPTVLSITTFLVAPSSMMLSVGSYQYASATITPEAAHQGVTWTTSDASKADVDQSGLVTATGRGTATITATSKGDSNRKGTISVTVTGTETVTPREVFGLAEGEEKLLTPLADEYGNTVQLRVKNVNGCLVYLNSISSSGEGWYRIIVDRQDLAAGYKFKEYNAEVGSAYLWGSDIDGDFSISFKSTSENRVDFNAEFVGLNGNIVAIPMQVVGRSSGSGYAAPTEVAGCNAFGFGVLLFAATIPFFRKKR